MLIITTSCLFIDPNQYDSNKLYILSFGLSKVALLLGHNIFMSMHGLHYLFT